MHKNRRNVSPERRAQLAEQCRRWNEQSRRDLEAGVISRWPGGRKRKPPPVVQARLERAAEVGESMSGSSSRARKEERPESAEEGVRRLRREHDLDEGTVIAMRRGADGRWRLADANERDSGRNRLIGSAPSPLAVYRRAGYSHAPGSRPDPL